MVDAYGNMTYADLAASADARGWLNSQIQQSYYNSLAAGNDASTALKQAQFDWQKGLDTANQTGMWNGQWNNPQQQWFTSQFGQWYGAGGEPGKGSFTLPAQQQALQQSALYGQYIAPGQAPTAGQQTLAAQNQAQQLGLSQAGLTGWYNAPGATGTPQQTLAGQAQQWGQGFQQQQFAAQQQQLQQQNAQNYLQMLSSLRGPADWAKYQEVLGSTPGGMRDLAAAAMGQYVPGGGATTGVQPQAANLQTMMGQIAGQGQQPGQGGMDMNYALNTAYDRNPAYDQARAQYAQAQMPSQNYWQPPQQQPAAAQPAAAAAQGGQYPTSASGLTQLTPDAQSYLYSGTGAQIGGTGWANPQASAAANASLLAPSSQQYQRQYQTGFQQPSSNMVMDNQAMQATGGGANMMGAPKQQYNLPAPNQIASQSWNNFTPSQQQMMLGQYEAQGYDKNDVQALYNQSLPKYGTNNASAGTWRLK